MTAYSATESEHFAAGPAHVSHEHLCATVTEILRSSARTDLHALVRISPFLNGNTWDTGWSCREHAVLLAALLRSRGVAANIVHGQNMFVLGPSASGDDPTGIGNGSSSSYGHTWVQVPGYGNLDISPRLDEHLGGPYALWRPLEISEGLVADTYLSGEHRSIVVFAESQAQYEQAIAIGSHAAGFLTAVYRPQKIEEFDVGMMEPGYLNSPLTKKLKDAVGADCYLKIAAHLCALLDGNARPLAGVSQGKAWRLLARTDPSVVAEFRQSLADGGQLG